MTEIIELSIRDLLLASLLVWLLALINLRAAKTVSRSLMLAYLRMIVQLSLVGLILKTLFQHIDLLWVAGIALIMVIAAGREAVARQRHHLKGWWGFGIASLSMLSSSFALALFSLAYLIQVDPWYHPQYAIPLLGMLLGNTLNGISISLDRLTESALQQKGEIEGRLSIGESWLTATEKIRHSATNSAMIPTINAMAAAGVVSLPGMMTGQILSGTAPTTAIRYQILIFLLIAVATGVGTLLTTWLASRRLFDERQRLRLDRLR